MSFNYKIFKSVAAAALMCSSLAVMADNKVYINDFTISDYNVTEVPVYLETTDRITQSDWNVILPAGLEVDGAVTHTKRVPSGFTTRETRVKKQSNGTTKIYFLYANVDITGNTFFVPGDSPVAYIPVKAAPGALDKDATETIKVTDIALPNFQGHDLATTETTTATVTLKRNVVENELTISCTNGPVVVNPGDKRQANLSMENNFNVRGLEFNLYLPGHISLTDFDLPEALKNDGWNLTVSDKNLATKGFMRFVMVSFQNKPIPAGVNDVLTFNIAADSEFNTTSEIRIDKIFGTDNTFQDNEGVSTTFEVVSGQVALEKATLALSEGDNSLANYITTAMNTISSECPLVADRDEFNMTPYFNKVQELMTAVEKGYADYTLTPDYDSIVTAPAAQIRSEVDALVAAAKDAQAAEEKRLADNKSAYDNDMAAIADLLQALEAAKEEVRKDYPDYADEDAEKKILDQINAMSEAADAEYKSVAEEGNYDYKLDAEPVLNAISNLVPAAAERYRVDTNKNMYDADMAKVAELQKKYDDGLAEIRVLNPSYEGDPKVLAMINDARTAVENEYARVEAEGFYESPEIDYDDIVKAIEKMVNDITVGIKEVNVEDLNLDGAEIYTLDGQRHKAPVKGQINVIRNQNSVIKVVVK